MNADKFDKTVKKSETGRHVVTLMRFADGGERFLSLVDKGANGRTFTVTKADTDPAASGALVVQGDIPAEGTPNDGTIYQAGWSFLARTFAPLFALGAIATFKRAAKPTTVAKDGAMGPITFEAALVPGEVWERTWEGFDALTCTIGNILRESTVTDKRGAIKLAVDQYGAYVVASFDAIAGVTMKADDLALIGSDADRAGLTQLLITLPALLDRARGSADQAGSDPAYKAGAVISKANAAKLRAAIDSLEAILENAGLIEPSTDEPASTSKGDDSMLTAAQLTAIAEAAAVSAVKVTKAANPAATPAELAEIGRAAAAQVFKVAVAGPPQPGMPANILQQQMMDSGAGFGGGSDPLSQFQTKLNTLGDALGQVQQTVAKIDAQINGKPEVAAKAAEGGKPAIVAQPAEPGLAEVVQKHDEVIGAVAATVKKIARTPAAPQGGGVDERRQRQAVAKSQDADDDDIFANTALGSEGAEAE